jgi:hypothetical protein
LTNVGDKVAAEALTTLEKTVRILVGVVLMVPGVAAIWVGGTTQSNGAYWLVVGLALFIGGFTLARRALRAPTQPTTIVVVQPDAAASPVTPPTPPPPPPADATAGWYPQPNGLPGRRYWDGTAWTEHTAP